MADLEPHQLRVIAEKAELDERRDKLAAFIRSDLFQTLPKSERDLLITQSRLMEQLSIILWSRIQGFKAQS